MNTVKIFGKRKFSSTATNKVKVAVVGAAGGIGSPLSLLLKLSPLVSELSLYDIQHAVGVATDLSHIDRCSKTTGVSGEENLKCALEGKEVVIVSAGFPRKPGMTRDDLFKSNASVVQKIAEACGKYCPKALIGIITNPVNTVVPIAAEVLKCTGTFYPERLFGVTTLDLVRASTFAAGIKGINPKGVYVPVIGGHSGDTMVPLLSRAEPKMEFRDEEIASLTKRIQDAGTEVVNAKGGTGSATLSMAYAAARFTSSLCRALTGEDNIVECTYVASNVTEAKYFASPVLLGKCGVQKILPLPKMSCYENNLLQSAIKILKGNIEKGEKFVNK